MGAARHCGLDAAAMAETTRSPLLGGKLREDPAAITYIYVNPKVMAMGDQCVASVSVSARTQVVTTLPSFPVADAVLWEDQALVSGPVANFGQRCNSVVRELLAEFITQVKMAKQR